MTRKTYYGMGATVAAIAFTVILGGSAIAQPPVTTRQTPPPQRKDSSDPNGIQSLMNGLNIGPLMMTFGGANGGMIDFTHSNERILLQRSDVRSDLFIDSRQREQLADLDAQSTQQLQRKMLETVIQSTVNNPDFKALTQLGSGQKPNPAVVQEVLNTSFQTMQDGLQAFETTLDGKEEALLNPKQIKRLHELDLQWRGLLALSDKKVADVLILTADQKTAVDSALKAYQTTQMATLEPLMNQAMQSSEQQSNNRRAPRTFDQQQIQRVLANAMESDTMVKARTSAEAKVRTSLTAEQLSLWKTMTGRKFYFVNLD